MEKPFATDGRSKATFTFTKENFSEVEDAVLSPPCMIRNLPWKILIMQRSNNNVKSLGFFLQCNGDSESSSWRCSANARLTILSQTEGIEDFTRKIQHSFSRKQNDWGFEHFISWNDVINPGNGFIKNDTVIFQAHVMAKAPSGINLENQEDGGDENLSFPNLSLINHLTKVAKTDSVIVENVILHVYLTDLKDAIEKRNMNNIELLLGLIRTKISVMNGIPVKDVTDRVKGQVKQVLVLAEVEIKHAEDILKLKKESSADSLSGAYSHTRIRIDWNPVPFCGKKDEWCHWWRIFESVIHQNETIDEEIKMKALTKCLKDDANDVLGDLPRTGENYQKAIAQLRNQYDDPVVLRLNYFNQLELLALANDLLSQRETVAKLRTIVQNLDALRGKLSINEDLIIRNIIQKFPNEVLHYALHSLKSSKQNIIFHPTPAELLGALEDYVEIKEFVAAHKMEITKA